MRYVQKAVIALFVVSVLLFGVSKIIGFIKQDSSAPVIESTKDKITVSCNYTQEEILSGLTAKDEQDGDLTDKIMVGNISRFTEYGKSNVTYVVFDSSNQPATYTREVVFQDYVSPRFHLAKPLVIKANESVNESDLVGATDVFDGDISRYVRVKSSNINYSVAGKYALNVEVINSFGDLVEAELPVYVVTDPETRVDIKLKENVLYIEKGDNFDPMSYVEGATSFFGNPMDISSVSAESHVNTDKVGCYDVKYTAIDDTGSRGVTYMVVFVTEKGEVK